MIINHDLNTINALRIRNRLLKDKNDSITKLSSGKRINKAADDAAGLAISEKMRSQIRGLRQSSRNIQDGISLIQTTEGALNEIHSLIQRGRELAVQASNDTLSNNQRGYIQEEIDEINSAIDGICTGTKFNGMRVLGSGLTGKGGAPGGGAPIGGTTSPSISTDKDITDGLRNYMLEVPEDLISNHYGISARPNSPLEIKYVNEGAGGSVAAVTTYFNSITGEGSKYILKIDRDDFFKDDLWISKDRIVAHEMVHGIMAASGMNWKNSAIPVWFKEGTAEYLPGADERVINDLARKGSNQALVDSINSPINTSEFYSASYTAIKYLDHKLKQEGQSIKTVMQSLSDGSLKTLDAALKELKNADGSNMYDTGESGFKNDFIKNGADFMTNHMDLSRNGGIDGVGSIIGNKNDDNVIPDKTNPKDNPLDNFKVSWGASTGYTPGKTTPYIGFSQTLTISKSISPFGILKIQTGANAGESIDIQLTQLNANILGIDNADIINNPNDAIELYDNAIDLISNRRANLGALQNRLEHSMKICDNTSENLSNSESRIRDLDMAKEVLNSSKLEILINANQSLMSQAKATREGILKLLS